MSRNIKKILNVLEREGGVIVGTASGSWFPKGTELPDPPIESALNHLSVSVFNCTCNWWTVRNMVAQGFLAATHEEREYELTEKARHFLSEGGLCV